MTTASANTVTLPQTGRPGRCSRWLGVALAVQLALAGEGLPGGDRTARAAEPPAQSGTRPAEGAPKPEPKAEVKPKPSRPRGATLWHDVEPVGQLATAALCEASGIVKSRKYEGLYWTHNDSGNPATLFAIREDGSVVARVPVSGARNSDWEDLALDEAGTLFIGDIGDNLHRRREHFIYEVPEPDPFAEPIKPVAPTRTWRFAYPAEAYDAESLFVYRGDLYVIPKTLRELPPLYRLERGAGDELTPVEVGRVPARAATAADVSADGTRLAVLSYGRLAVFTLADDWTQVLASPTQRVRLGGLFPVEACTFDGDDVIVVSETKHVWRITSAELANQPRLRLLPGSDASPEGRGQ